MCYNVVCYNVVCKDCSLIPDYRSTAFQSILPTSPLMPQSRFLALLVLLSLFLAAPLTASAQSTAPYDVIIRHGHVIDGTGSPWYAADVGVRDGHIAAIGDLSRASAKQSIDAHGMVV